MEWLLAANCRANQQTSSFGSLEGTNIHFSQSILPVNPSGHMMSGQYTLSPDQKRITATVGGECASVYFGRKKIYANGLLPIVTHEVPVWFDNIGKTSSFFWYRKYTLYFYFQSKNGINNTILALDMSASSYVIV